MSNHFSWSFWFEKRSKKIKHQKKEFDTFFCVPSFFWLLGFWSAKGRRVYKAGLGLAQGKPRSPVGWHNTAGGSSTPLRGIGGRGRLWPFESFWSRIVRDGPLWWVEVSQGMATLSDSAFLRWKFQLSKYDCETRPQSVCDATPRAQWIDNAMNHGITACFRHRHTARRND